MASYGIQFEITFLCDLIKNIYFYIFLKIGSNDWINQLGDSYKILQGEVSDATFMCMDFLYNLRT